VLFRASSLSLNAGRDLLFVVVANTATGPSPVSLVLNDGFVNGEILDAGTTSDLRVIHAAPDAPALDVIADPAVEADPEITLADAVGYLDVTAYQSLPPANYTIRGVLDSDPSPQTPPFTTTRSLLRGQRGTLLATGLLLLQRRRLLAGDTALGLLAHAGLALGLVTLSFLEFLRVDLLSYLFGDLLAVGRPELLLIWGGGLLVLGALALIWRPLLRVTLHEELAAAEGLPVFALQLAFLLLLAIVVATAMKVVGILLITALLILPAAAARRLAATPEAMALGAALIGCAAVGGGLWGSWTWDTPSGPSIVVAALAIFLALHALPRRARTA